MLAALRTMIATVGPALGYDATSQAHLAGRIDSMLTSNAYERSTGGAGAEMDVDDSSHAQPLMYEDALPSSIQRKDAFEPAKRPGPPWCPTCRRRPGCLWTVWRSE